MRTQEIYKLSTFVTIGIASLAIIAFMTVLGVSDTTAYDRTEVEAEL